MLLLMTIDRTVDKPVNEVNAFADKEALLAYLGFDKDMCGIDEDEDGNNDAPCNFDEDELASLFAQGSVYRDKREVYQLIEVSEALVPRVI